MFKEAILRMLRLPGNIAKKIIRKTAFIFATVFARFCSDRGVRGTFERACGEFVLRKLAHKGKNCRIHGFIEIYDSEKLTIGDHVRIGKGCFLFCMGGLTIGDNTQISRYVTIYTANHNIQGDAIPYNDEYVRKPVHIGRSVWIGMNVCITPGVTIGDGAVIGMGAVVSKDVPAGCVVASNKQRIIKRRDTDQFAELDRKGMYFAAIWPDK